MKRASCPAESINFAMAASQLSLTVVILASTLSQLHYRCRPPHQHSGRQVALRQDSAGYTPIRFPTERGAGRRSPSPLSRTIATPAGTIPPGPANAFAGNRRWNRGPDAGPPPGTETLRPGRWRVRSCANSLHLGSIRTTASVPSSPDGRPPSLVHPGGHTRQGFRTSLNDRPRRR
jgi:hypothetical protein